MVPEPRFQTIRLWFLIRKGIQFGIFCLYCHIFSYLQILLMAYIVKDSKVIYDLKPTISEQQSDWYINFREFSMEYVPRAPPNRASHPYDVYLQKCAAARKRGRIRSSDVPIVDRTETSINNEIRLKDHVISQLNVRVFKLEAIIQVISVSK